jgi:hypothetical protein
MKIDISTLTYEELFINDDVVTMYFIAPKELVAEKYPEAEFATICIEYSRVTGIRSLNASLFSLSDQFLNAWKQ